jgi:hypothetical protein
MFVSDEVLLEVGFPAAQAGLAALAQDSSLLNAAENAYGAAARSLARVSPPGAVPGISTLAEVRFRDLVARDGSALLTLRWDVTGPGGALFPALDADITLTRTGGQATLLALTGVYRPPLGILGAPLDRAVLRGCRGHDPRLRHPHRRGHCPPGRRGRIAQRGRRLALHLGSSGGA